MGILNKIFISLACAMVVIAFIGIGMCAEEPAKPVKTEYTKEEMVSNIKDDLETYDEIFDTLPGLKAEKDSAGKIFYNYNGVKLEDMNKEELAKLFGKVGPLVVKLRTERIQNQLQIARQAAGGQAPRAPVVIPSTPQPPRLLTPPPAVPRVTTPPPSVPKASSPPPTPPPSRK